MKTPISKKETHEKVAESTRRHLGPPEQFRLRTLLLVVGGYSVLFAILRAIGAPLGEMVGGFAILTCIAMFAISCIESSGVLHRRPSERYVRRVTDKYVHKRTTTRESDDLRTPFWRKPLF